MKTYKVLVNGLVMAEAGQLEVALKFAKAYLNGRMETVTVEQGNTMTIGVVHE